MKVSSGIHTCDDNNDDAPLTDFQRKLVLSESRNEREDGVVITPEPTGVVIKTLLKKEKKKNHLPLDESVDDHYLPRTLSSIYAASQNNQVAEIFDAGDLTNKAEDIKVFLNICIHPLLAVPGRRKGLEEGSGEEIHGWRIPMSLGEIRPCYDKMGKAAIAADCVLNPCVIQDMNADSSYFDFVCDAIIQCASRKFGQTWFGGRDLDRRFKLPKMKYAGYVDELTGFPTVPGENEPIHLSVAKQRVKVHGGKSSIIEELDDTLDARVDDSTVPVSTPTPTSLGLNAEKTRDAIAYRIELYITLNQKRIPLFEFLRATSDIDDILPHGYPSIALRELIRSPKLKFIEDTDLHDSQRLNSPIPIDNRFLNNSAKILGPGKSGTFETVYHLNIIASCSTRSKTWELERESIKPTVELSAFVLFVSGVECVLPFPVNVNETIVTITSQTRGIEVRMPILNCSGPDPGTRQWNLQHALRDEDCRTTDNAIFHSNTDLSDGTNESEGRWPELFLINHDEEEDSAVDSEQLPEDAFHSHDALSRHILQQQENDEITRKCTKSKSSYDGANVDDEYFSEEVNSTAQRNDHGASDIHTLKMAENVLKNSLRGHDCTSIVMGLV